MALRLLGFSGKVSYCTRGFASTSSFCKEAITIASSSKTQSEHVQSADKGKKGERNANMCMHLIR